MRTVAAFIPEMAMELVEFMVVSGYSTDRTPT